jgi:uncharacterized protein YlxP (DUF503 family)
MFTGLMTVQMHLHGLNSLKDKRSIVKSLIERLRSRFNVSVAEVDHNDSRTSAVIGIAVISNDKTHAASQLDVVERFIRGDGRFGVGETEREVV